MAWTVSSWKPCAARCSEGALAELIHPVRAEWGDCDPAGIWHYPTLFRWIDAAAHHLLREVGVAPGEMTGATPSLAVPVVEAHARFRGPATYYDALEVRCQVAEIRARAFRLEYAVVRPGPAGEVLATAYEVRVCVGRGADGSIAAQELPAFVREGLAQFAPSP